MGELERITKEKAVIIRGNVISSSPRSKSRHIRRSKPYKGLTISLPQKNLGRSKKSIWRCNEANVEAIKNAIIVIWLNVIKWATHNNTVNQS